MEKLKEAFNKPAEIGIVAFDPKENVTASYRKTNGFSESYEILGIETEGERKGQIRGYGSLRLYQPGTVVYACLWLSDGRSIHCSGSGMAGGGGYHKQSAAAHNAIRSAGIQLSESIHGVGSSAITRALLAIAKHLNIQNPHIHNAHA